MSSLSRIRASTELFMKNFLFWSSPSFSHLNLPTTSSPNLGPLLPEPSQGYSWPQSSVTNFFSFITPQYESNHHKQDLLITTSMVSHCFSQLQIRKSSNFHLRSACDYEFHTHPHPTSTFLTACRRSKENISIPVVMQKDLEPTFLHSKFSFPWFILETKIWNLRLTLRSPSLN